MRIHNRLLAIENILGDNYDLDRLKELVAADAEGRCVVLMVKPGEKVKPVQRPEADPEVVDCVSIYKNGRITYGFHEIGIRKEWVDRWEEEESYMYIPENTAKKEATHENHP